jgi:hypothetical protein
MKDQTAKEKIKADATTEVAKLKQQDDHKKLELVTQKEIEQMKLGAKQGDNEGKLAVVNQKMMHDREEHQLDMVDREDERRLNQQKADQAAQQHTMKADDMLMRQQERQAAQQFKQQGFPP